MSTFAVFGFSREQARRIATRQAEKEADRDPEGWTIERFTARIAELTDELFAEHGVGDSQISPLFDAPQFARDWIAVAGDQVKVACIKSRCQITIDGKIKTIWEPI